MSKNANEDSPTELQEPLKPPYNPQILESFEYFLSQEETQDNLIHNLINDYKSKTTKVKQGGQTVEVTKPGALSTKTVLSLVGSFLKAPFKTWNLLKFYRNQDKYNTPEFQTALLNSDKTWDFVDRTADNLENVSTLMTNMGVDLFQEGKPLDQKGMSRIKGALKNPEFISAIKDLAVASRGANPNYLELSSKLLGAIDKAPNASAFLSEKGKSIQDYITASVESQINQDAALRKEWSELSQNPNKQKERIEKIKFLKRVGITGKAYEEALQNGTLPKTLKENIAEYGMQPKDLNNILNIVPILLDSPGQLKGVIDSVNQGKYSDIARQVIDLAEEKPEIKEYLNENKEVFGKIINTMLQSNEHFANSGLGGQVYNLVPALFNNPAALKEIINIYDKGDYVAMAPKIFELIEKDPDIRNYFAENSAGFEKLTTAIIQDTIKQSRESLKQENIDWQKLDSKAKRNYLDNNPAWKDYSDSAKDRMVKRGKLQDLGETLSMYGIDEKDIGSISHIAMLTLNNPKHVSAILGSFAKGDFTNVAQDVLTLFEESPEVKKFLIQEKSLIGKIVQTNLANTPGLEDIDVTDLVPFLLNHPKEFKEIIQMAQQEKYDGIAPKIFELAKEDRTLANYLKQNQSTLTKAALKSTGFDQYGLSEDISDIFVQLTTETNLTKLQKLAELAADEQWVKVGAGLADLIDKDPEFRRSLDNNRDNINKIVEIVLLKNPSLRSSISALETGALANNLLSDPGGVRDLLNAYESGNKVALAGQITKFTTKKIFNSEFRGVVYDSAVNWIYGKGDKQQELASAIAGALNKRDNPSERIVLSDFVESAFKEISENIDSSKERNRFLKQINNKNFFEGITIEGFGKPLKFHNLDINENQFVNTTFKNVSFEGTKLTNASFHGASFERVSFKGATIDSKTLESLLPAIKNGSVSLSGVKITGSLDNMDLKDISFRDADLSAVTSMKEANISGANLIIATLPTKKDILTETFGLKSAAFASGAISTEQRKSNQEKICEIIATKISKKSKSEGATLSSEEVEALKQKIVKLYNDKSEVGERFRNSINTHSNQLLKQSFPVKSSSISHVSEYKGQASHQLTLIYENIKNLDKIESALVADILADEVTTNLFEEGRNRGKDGLQIQKALETAISDIASEYDISAKELLANPKLDSLLEEITENVRSKTKYTTAGMVSGGIYLPEGVLKPDELKQTLEKAVLSEKTMSRKIANQMIAMAEKNGIEIENEKALRNTIDNIYNDKSNTGIRLRFALKNNLDALLKGEFPENTSKISNVSDYKGTASHQLSIIYNNINSPELMKDAFVADHIAGQVTSSLFGDGANRGKDGLQIQKAVTDIIKKFSKDNDVSIHDILDSEALSDFISELTEDIKSKTKYTSVGMVSGGIYLPEDAISSDMINELTNKMNMALGDHALTSSEKELISDISEDIASNIFGDNVEETNAKDLEQIQELLEKTFYELKEDNPDMDLEATLIANRDELIGNLDRGYFSTTGEGLTKLFYDNATYTGGSLSGNIQTSDFKESITEKIEESIEGNITKSVRKTPNVERDSGEKVSSITKSKAVTIGDEIPTKNSGKQTVNPTKVVNSQKNRGSISR